MDWRDKLNALKTDLPEGEELKVELPEESKSKVQKEQLRVELDKRKVNQRHLLPSF